MFSWARAFGAAVKMMMQAIAYVNEDTFRPSQIEGSAWPIVVMPRQRIYLVSS
jgi:hypothetical protein